MANALLDGDFGGGFGGYVGGGAGRAWASQAGDNDNAWAYQGIAGLRYALTPNLDAGVKYRYFRTGKLNFNDAFAVNAVPFTTETLRATTARTACSRAWSTISTAAWRLRRSRPQLRRRRHRRRRLPRRPRPAPDGSVILATSACPAPAPPPPPPLRSSAANAA